MEIKDIQTQKAVEKILTNLLKTGVNPDYNTFLYYLNEYFKNNVPGTPTMKLNKVKEISPMQEREIMDSKKYNEMLDGIEDDLDSLYKATINNNRKIIENFTFLENIRGQILHKLNKYDNQVHNIIEESKSSHSKKVVTEEFFDFNNFDIKETTGLVDLNFNSGILMPHILDSGKANAKVESIEMVNYSPRDRVEYEELSAPENMIDDYLNDTWIGKFHPHNHVENIENITVIFEITFSELIEFSHIEITTNEKLKKEIEVLYKDEGWENINLQDNTVVGKKRWTFNKIATDCIRLQVTKKINHKNLKNYYIMNIQDLSLYKTEFEKTGRIISFDYPLDKKVFEKVKIEAEEITPSGTNIFYNIFLKGDQEVATTLKNGESFNLNNVVFQEENLSYDNISYSHSTYNNNYWTFNKQLQNPIKDEAKVYKGISGWQKKVYSRQRPADHEATLSDWNNRQVNEKNTLNFYETFSRYSSDADNTRHTPYLFGRGVKEYIKDGQILTLPNIIEIKSAHGISNGEITEVNYDVENLQGEKKKVSFNSNYDIYRVDYDIQYSNVMLETYLYSSTNQVFKTREIMLSRDFETNQAMNKFNAYLNNRRLEKIVEDGWGTSTPITYNIRLQKGWNKLAVVYYDVGGCRSLLHSRIGYPVGQMPEDPELYRPVGDWEKQRAYKDSLQYCDPYTFENKIAKNEHSYFTINDNNQIVINDMRYCKYKVKYPVPRNNYNKVSFEAIMETDNRFITPEIHDLNLHFSY